MTELDDVRAAVLELRGELAALRESLATEVRTQRLVVVDADGVDRIVTQHLSASTSLIVSWTNEQGVETTATMSAGAECGGEAHFCITAAGDVVTQMGALVNSIPAPHQPCTAVPDLRMESVAWRRDDHVTTHETVLTLSPEQGLRVRSGQLTVTAPLEVTR